MNRKDRISTLSKIAKKSDGLSGTMSAKDISKFLAKVKKNWLSTKSDLADAMKKMEDLETLIEDLKGKEESLKGNIGQCHDVIKVFDYTDANHAKFTKSDTLYSKDGKGSWMCYNADTHSLEKKLKKVFEEEEKEEAPAPASPLKPIFDDVENKEEERPLKKILDTLPADDDGPEELEEGFEVTREEI